MNLIRTVMLLSSSLCAACAGLPPKEPPPQQAAEERIVERLPTDEEKYAGRSVPGTHFGVSTSSSGNLLVGLLVPGGAALNAAYTQSEAERQATPTREFFKTDLRTVLRSHAPNAQAGDAPSGAQRYFALVPSAVLEFRSDENFKVRCALNTKLFEDGKESWRSRYIVQSEGTFARTRTEDLARAQAELGSCLEKAYGLFQQHRARELGPLKDYSVTTDYYMNVPVLESALPGRIIYVDFLGVYEMRKSDVRSITPR